MQNWAHGSGNFHRHRGRGFAGFYPYYGGYYSYGYGGCAWLYAQAVASGSGYWWQRYYDCVGYWVIISQYRRARKPAVNRPPERASVSRS